MSGVDAGTEWLVDAQGCRSDLLSNLRALADLCQQIIDELGLKVVGQPVWHQFPSPSGVTGIYLLSESHLTCHTFPETGLVTFNLYCCRPRPAWPWRDRLRALLGATQVKVRSSRRGQFGSPAENPSSGRKVQGVPR